MQLTMSSADCKYKTAACLRDDLYRGDEVLLLDCRPNDEYKRGHIKNAYNITLPQLMMRRLKSNKLSLEKLVPPNFRHEKESFLKKCMTHTVLLYDQYSYEVNANTETSLMALLLRRMVHEKCNVYVLKGGYGLFQRENPEYCNAGLGSEDDEYSGDSSQSDDSNVGRLPRANKKDMSGGVTPLLGLSELSISCDLENKSPSLKTLGEVPGSLHARRAKRRMQTLTITTTRNSEGESENYTSSAASSDSTTDITVLSPLNCNNNSVTHDIIDSKSPSNANFGNADYPVEIMPYLFLGCHQDAKNKEVLNSHGITYILNVTPNLPNVFEDDKSFHYKKIAISDHWSQNLSQFFPEAIEFIDEAREKHCGILVHCLAGISRSVTVTVAYLMQKEKWSLNDAYDFVKQRKSNVSPNFNFMGQLLDFEKTLGLTNTTSEHQCDSGIASSSSCVSSTTTPPTLFFTSPPPPTPTAVNSNGSTCASKSGLVPKEHRSIFCLPTPMS